MIVASLLLVIAAAVTLLIGLFNRADIEWVYASIACCLLAGVLLTIGVLRSRPSRKPVLQSGGHGQGASWAGASGAAGASGWGGPADRGGAAGSAVLTPDEDVAPGAAGGKLQGDDEPTRTGMPAAPVPADETSPWARQDDDQTGDVRVVPPPTAPTAEEPPPAESAPADETKAEQARTVDEDVVVVPKPSARAGSSTPADPGSGMAADHGGATGVAATPGAETTVADAARFEQALSPIAGVGPAKRRAIHQHFGTYGNLREASPEKIAEVQGISPTLAARIHTALHSQ
ncbi:MAG: hypothetical protein GEU74_01780 [Nitriliruptorales bacterium]|nr:hypothetical protein [Nitriliruptorales bacterium]